MFCLRKLESYIICFPFLVGVEVFAVVVSVVFFVLLVELLGYFQTVLARRRCVGVDDGCRTVVEPVRDFVVRPGIGERIVRPVVVKHAQDECGRHSNTGIPVSVVAPQSELVHGIPSSCWEKLPYF